jgi:hypothetical protein
MDSWRESDRREVIDGDQFIFHFQPKVDLRTARNARFEALARWVHPQRGIISPDEFIIEETGSGDCFAVRMLQRIACALPFEPASQFLCCGFLALCKGRAAHLDHTFGRAIRPKSTLGAQVHRTHDDARLAD